MTAVHRTMHASKGLRAWQAHIERAASAQGAAIGGMTGDSV